MSENTDIKLDEIRDLLQEQNELIREIRDMNKESMQRMHAAQDRNELMLTAPNGCNRSPRTQSH